MPRPQYQGRLAPPQQADIAEENMRAELALLANRSREETLGSRERAHGHTPTSRSRTVCPATSSLAGRPFGREGTERDCASTIDIHHRDRGKIGLPRVDVYIAKAASRGWRL